MNWIIITKFSLILFVSSFLIGVAQGLAIGINENYLNIVVNLGMVVSLVIKIIIFISLAKVLTVKPFQHAIVVSILTSVVGIILFWLVSGSFSLSSVISEVVSVILALVVGTNIGIYIRSKSLGNKNA